MTYTVPNIRQELSTPVVQGQPTTMDKTVLLPDSPPEEWKIETEIAKMKEIADEDRRTVREKLSRETGYTGLSILHRLNSLYGFDVIRDIVFDVMHNLPLNIVGCSLKQLIAEEKLDAKEVDERLANFPWTAGILNMYAGVICNYMEM